MLHRACLYRIATHWIAAVVSAITPTGAAVPTAAVHSRLPRQAAEPVRSGSNDDKAGNGVRTPILVTDEYSGLPLVTVVHQSNLVVLELHLVTGTDIVEFLDFRFKLARALRHILEIQ